MPRCTLYKHYVKKCVGDSDFLPNTTDHHDIAEILLKMALDTINQTYYVSLRCSVRLYLQLFVGGFMSYLRCLCIVVFNTKCCCIFVLFFFVLPVSLDCPLLVAPAVFYNV